MKSFNQSAHRDSVKPVQVFELRPGQLILNESNLRSVLQHPILKELPDCPLVIVAVAGAARTGKSFLLNVLLEILYAAQAGDEGTSSRPWHAEGARLRGFHFSHSAAADTNGIWFWGEPILLRQRGQLHAVILADTQGLFHAAESEEKLSFALFALSTLISSVQVFNVMRNVEGPSMSFYRLLVKYAGDVMRLSGGQPNSANMDSHAFQSMIMCIRDWSFHYYHTGIAPADFLSKNGNDLKETAALFMSSKCALLPTPFLHNSYDFTGAIEEVREDFIKTVDEAFALPLVSGEFRPKFLNGRRASAQEMIGFIKTLADGIRKHKELLPDDVVTANRKMVQEEALRCGEEEYRKNMAEVLDHAEKPPLSKPELLQLHEACKMKAIDAFWGSARAEQMLRGEKSVMHILNSVLLTHYESFSRLNDLRAEAARLASETSRLATQRDAAERAVAEQQTRIDEQHENIQKLEVDITRVEAEKTRSEEEKSEMRTRFEASLAEEKRSADEREVGNVPKLAMLRAEMERQRAAEQQMQEELRRQHQSLQDDLNRMREEHESQKARLEEEQERVRRMERDLQEARRKQNNAGSGLGVNLNIILIY